LGGVATLLTGTQKTIRNKNQGSVLREFRGKRSERRMVQSGARKGSVPWFPGELKKGHGGEKTEKDGGDPWKSFSKKRTSWKG